MFYKQKYLFFFLFIFNVYGCAQTKPILNDSIQASSIKSDSNFKFVQLIEGNFSYLDVDVLNNIYVINETNQLKKLNQNGDSLAVYNDVKQFGNPSLIDVSNPLKNLVYFKNYSTVVVLDRFLSFRNTINFRNTNIFKANVIATSYDNNIWLFDEQDFKLKKINDDGTLLTETSDGRQLFDEVPTPTNIIDKDGFVYLYDAEKGFYIFDYYGSLKNNLPFLHWEHIAVSGNKIYGFLDNKLLSYQLQSFNTKEYVLPNFFKQYKNIKAINGFIYLLKTEGVEVYKIL